MFIILLGSGKNFINCIIVVMHSEDIILHICEIMKIGALKIGALKIGISQKGYVRI